MVTVIVMNNTDKEFHPFDESTLLRDVIAECGIAPSPSVKVSFEFAEVTPNMMTKSLAELGFTGEAGKDSCYLSSVVKQANA